MLLCTKMLRTQKTNGLLWMMTTITGLKQVNLSSRLVELYEEVSICTFLFAYTESTIFKRLAWWNEDPRPGTHGDLTFWASLCKATYSTREHNSCCDQVLFLLLSFGGLFCGVHFRGDQLIFLLHLCENPWNTQWQHETILIHVTAHVHIHILNASYREQSRVGRYTDLDKLFYDMFWWVQVGKGNEF
jgi:hypothetical protein